MRNKGVRLIILTVLGLAWAQSIAMAALPPRCVRLRYLIFVAATTPTTADIANHIGGTKVLVTPLLKANQDFSNPTIYGSMKHAVREAEVMVRLGAGLDPWMHGLLRELGNKTITPRSSLDVDCSVGIAKPKGSDSLRYYWLDPANAKIIAANIMAGLASFSPRDSDYFRRNYEKFCNKVDESLSRWQSELAPYMGAKIVSCCGTLGYFASRFGLDQVAAIGSRPCTSHSSAQIDSVVSLAGKENEPKIIALEPGCPVRVQQAILGQENVKLAELPEEVGATRNTRDYFALLDIMVASMRNALATACSQSTASRNQPGCRTAG